MIHLGVNIDHVATIREARKTNEPDPAWAASESILGGADSITIHLREDRRHIQDRDLYVLRKTVPVKLNLEMALSEEIIKIALDAGPEQVTIVPEKREEVTTEGGLDVPGNRDLIRKTAKRFNNAGICVSLFVDPEPDIIRACKDCNVPCIELHTGAYANAEGDQRDNESRKLIQAAEQAVLNNIRVNAGHGLTYQNIIPVLDIPGLDELNIGHSIISRSVFTGIRQAVTDMKKLICRTP